MLQRGNPNYFYHFLLIVLILSRILRIQDGGPRISIHIFGIFFGVEKDCVEILLR